MESRIKMLREKRGLIQELLAVEIGVTQQMLSKYEKDITAYSARTAHPFRRNGAPFRFKLSKAQQVD